MGSGSPEVDSLTLTGPNEGYIVQGSGSIHRVYQMDWVSDTAITSSVKSIDVGANSNIINGARLQSDSGFNIVTASDTIFRFNAQPSVDFSFQEYSVQTGEFYAYPIWVAQTNYMFVSARGFINLADKKLYRLHSD